MTSNVKASSLFWNFFLLPHEASLPTLRHQKSLFFFQIVLSVYVELGLAVHSFLMANLEATFLHSGIVAFMALSLVFFRSYYRPRPWTIVYLALLVGSNWASVLFGHSLGSLIWNVILPINVTLMKGSRPGFLAVLYVAAAVLLQETYFTVQVLNAFPFLMHYAYAASTVTIVLSLSLYFLGLLLLQLFNGTFLLYKTHELEMKQLLFSARESEERFVNQINFLQTLMDLIPFPLFYKDLEGKFLSCNASFCVVFDTTKDAVFGHTNHEVFRGENATVMSKIELEVLSREIMAAEEASMVHADGKNHDFIVYFMPFLTVNKSLQGFIGVLIDITERKNKEIALVQLNETKDQLFSIISHDLRGPVGKVKQLLDVYIDDHDLFDAPTWSQVFHDMRKSADSLFQLLENLLSWARAQKGDYVPHPEVFPLEPLINEVFSLLKLLAADKSIELSMDLKLQGPLLADKAILSTIVRNLVHNALKFTPKGGKVTVVSEETPDEVRITVVDTGVGIPPEALSKIMARSERITTHGTAKEKGQGLGIGLCLELAKTMGAYLRAESNLGTGTKFTLVIPTPELSDL